MKRILPIVFIAIAAVSCNRKDTKNDFDGLLKQPPYKVYTDSIANEPKRASLYFSRGTLLLENRQPEPALADFEKAWELQPTDIHGWYYGGMLINVQRYDSAIDILKKAGEQFPANLSIKERLAYAYNLAKKPGNALQVYDEILRRDSSDYRSWAAKGDIYEKMGQDSLAFMNYKRSYALKPDQSTGEEIAFYMAQNKDPQTVAFCQLLIKRDSVQSSVQPYYCMGLYNRNTGNTAEAIRLFDYCIKTDYTFPDPYMDKGEILYDQKKYDEALKIFQLAKTNNNAYADAYYWVGKCYEAQGKKQEAALEYERTLALDKDFAEAKEALKRVKS